MKRLRTMAVGGVSLLCVSLLWCGPWNSGSVAEAAGTGPDGRGGCAADLVADGVVDVQDVFEVMTDWGPCAACPSDVNGDGSVDGEDLLGVILAFGPCAPDVELGVLPPGACVLDDGSFTTSDGGCRDLATGLVWSSKNMGNIGSWTHGFAQQLVEESTEGGFSDWRLATREEMETVAANGGDTHLNLDVECIGTTHRWWSSTTSGNRWAWAVNLCTGEAFRQQRAGVASDALLFVGVREAGPPEPPDPCNNDGFCDPGEDCENCGDCVGVQNGPPSGRHCCGDGVTEGPEGDGRCHGNP